MPNAYDRVRYPGRPFLQAWPGALGALAQLSGLPFAPFESCRMLEIGCGDGVNLINLALQAPRARLVGVDLAEGPIASARADAEACGCRNLEFRAADICDVGAALGEFDYIVAHGVLAWTPEPVGQALFRTIGESLAPNGVAMVSFNALPGSRARQALRDMLLFETRGMDSPEEKLKRAVDFMQSSVANWSTQEADGLWMIDVVRRILSRAPEVLFHDELGEIYAPRLLSEVAALASANGLTYLCDARARICEEAWFPSEAAADAHARAGGDWTRLQQYLDFQQMRAFHNAVFVRGVPDRRRLPGRLRGLFAQCRMREAAPDPAKPDERIFSADDGVRLTTNDPRLADLLVALSQSYPEYLALDDAPDLNGFEPHLYRLIASGLMHVSICAPPARREPGECPLASPLTRLQAARGERDLATLTQSVLQIDGSALQALLLLLDGTRDRDALVADWAAAAGLEASDAGEALERALATLAQAGVLEG